MDATVGASKISSKDAEAVTLRNYEGRVWISGGDAQWEKDRMLPVRLRQGGERPVWLFSAGNAWCESEPVFTRFWYTNVVADSHGVMEFQFDIVWRNQVAGATGAADLAESLLAEPLVLLN